MKTMDNNIGFCEKRKFFADNWRKSLKIVIITSTPVRQKCDILEHFWLDRKEQF
jgi:hypothetical protein